MARPRRELDKVVAALRFAEEVLDRTPLSADDAAARAKVTVGKDFQPKELELLLSR